MLSIGIRDDRRKFGCSLPRLWVSGPFSVRRVDFTVELVKHLQCLKFNDSGGRENRWLAFESLGRPVWNGDEKLGRIGLESATTAKNYIDIIAGKVVLLDPLAFEEVYRAAREYWHSQQVADARSLLPAASLSEATNLKGNTVSAKRQHTVFFGIYVADFLFGTYLYGGR